MHERGKGRLVEVTASPCKHNNTYSTVQCDTGSCSLGLQELFLAEVVQGPVFVHTQGEVPSPPRVTTGGCNGEVEQVVEGLGGLLLPFFELGLGRCITRGLQMTQNTHTRPCKRPSRQVSSSAAVCTCMYVMIL